MTAQPPLHKFTPEEYLAFERQSDERHEYVDGDIYSMVGASERHSWITMNIGVSLHSQLVRQGCRIYSEGMRVRARMSRSYFYPDLVAVCGERDIEHNQIDVLLNPTVLIEVLSPSTEQYDRGYKFLQYQSIESLQIYLLVSQDIAQIELFVRDEIGWNYRKVEGLDAVLDLAAIQCTLPLAEVYTGLSFDEADL